jgi:hypothetical protein
MAINLKQRMKRPRQVTGNIPLCLRYNSEVSLVCSFPVASPTDAIVRHVSHSYECHALQRRHPWHLVSHPDRLYQGDYWDIPNNREPKGLSFMARMGSTYFFSMGRLLALSSRRKHIGLDSEWTLPRSDSQTPKKALGASLLEDRTTLSLLGSISTPIGWCICHWSAEQQIY